MNYFVIHRGYAIIDGRQVKSIYSTIKCRQCRHKWRSDARYIDKLPDGKERTYKKLTDEMVLELIRQGRIKVDVHTGEVRKQQKHKGNWSWIQEWIVLKQTPCRAGYPFVDIKNDNHRKWLPVHKLVWMVYHDRLVPDEHDIDHLDHNRANPNIRNLRLRSSSENRGDKTYSELEDEIPF